jgi:DNA-binding LacI/PurR family transcriptional regulator
MNNALEYLISLGHQRIMVVGHSAAVNFLLLDLSARENPSEIGSGLSKALKSAGGGAARDRFPNCAFVELIIDKASKRISVSEFQTKHLDQSSKL